MMQTVSGPSQLCNANFLLTSYIITFDIDIIIRAFGIDLNKGLQNKV